MCELSSAARRDTERLREASTHVPPLNGKTGNESGMKLERECLGCTCWRCCGVLSETRIRRASSLAMVAIAASSTRKSDAYILIAVLQYTGSACAGSSRQTAHRWGQTRTAHQAKPVRT